MHHYHYRLRVFLLSLGVVLGFGGGIAHLAGHRSNHHQHWAHDCAERGWSWDGAPWQSPADKPAQNSTSAPKKVQ